MGTTKRLHNMFSRGAGGFTPAIQVGKKMTASATEVNPNLQTLKLFTSSGHFSAAL